MRVLFIIIVVLFVLAYSSIGHFTLGCGTGQRIMPHPLVGNAYYYCFLDVLE